ncbi:hypothetical protein Scep_000704 [Stephania cephalantha]|uniref:Uncharacterized protein n=1 Tax=Stephania cephalantha TaxID=152367 RepID=A0AAP0L826_9MAGN
MEHCFVGCFAENILNSSVSIFPLLHKQPSLPFIVGIRTSGNKLKISLLTCRVVLYIN